MALKPKSSDAGNLDLPKRNHQDLPLSEKVKVLDLIKKGNKSYAEVAKIYSKNESSICQIMRKEKKMCSFCSHTSKCKSCGHSA